MEATARKVALTIMEDVSQGAFLNLALKKELAPLSEQDRRFCARLCYTALENLIKIDYVIDFFAKGKRIHRMVRNILRLGACQLMYFESVPPSAAVNESVKLCERSPKRQLKGFVNAILHKIAEHKQAVVFPDPQSEPVRALCVEYSYPQWLVEKYLADYGRVFTQAMLRYTRPAYTCIRANRLKISPEELDRKLAFPFECGRYAPDARYIKNITAVDALPAYIAGEMTVQSESSMLVVEAADIQEGESVLDVCAAPGGKSAYAAQKKPAFILAMDVHGHRVALMKKNFARLGVKAQTLAADAAVPNPSMFGKFDKVLIDAPCSALGLLYRKPDIKYTKTWDDTQSLALLQQEIIETCSRYVKWGGVLIYSTCTINQQENEQNIRKFLQRHANFCEKDLCTALPNIPKERFCGGMLQLFPHLDGVDGFFIAALERKT